MFRKILHSPQLSLMVGIILLCTAGYEILQTIEESSIGAHHGLLIYSLTHCAKAVSEMKEGLKELAEVIE